MKEELKKKLKKDEYNVLVEKGTEAQFTGEYLHNKKKGAYLCKACSNELFSSETKFDSGTGWPSFHSPVSDKKVEMKEDNSHGMKRVEVICSKCGGHLGHVFDDGPKPTGLRYCINSKALNFKEKKAKK